jgi:SecD/SecF fusion protein
MALMSRGLLVRFGLVLLLLAGCVALSLNKDPRLGLDLSGGTQILLQTKDSDDGTKANAENTDRTVGILSGRVNALGVAEATVVRSGENRIIVELPDVQDPESAQEAIGKTAQLTIHAVESVATGPDAEPTQENGVVLQDEDTGEWLDLGPAALKGNDITSAREGMPENSSSYAVDVTFSRTGADAFGELSAAAACETGAKNRIAIVLDDSVISSPSVNVPCGQSMRDSTQITGNFTLEEAKTLAMLIEGGALPLEIETLSVSVVGPTLGDAAIEASWQAGLIGIGLTLLFITFVYRLVGFLATLALTTYALMSYAMLLAVGATLTLPGLAGFVLAIGLAIDANVLVFERAKEEYAAFPAAGLKRSLDIGYNKAWSAILDTNVTTLLAAALLFMLGSGAIKGFGVTLSIGVIASMISALVVARVFTELALSTRFFASRPKLSGIGHVGSVRTWIMKKNFNIMGRRAMWLIITSAVLVAALAGVAVRGLNMGLEFTGGRVLEYSTTQDVSVDDAREAVSDAGFPTATVQEADGGERIAVRVGQITSEEADSIEAAIAEIGGGAEQVRDEEISAAFGDELREKAIIAFLLAFAAQMVYLAFRFKWTFGLSAIVAMAHDVLIVVGLFAWLGKPIDGIFLASIMTVIGLSVNDTVVVFDRIRERWWGSKPEDGFAGVANTACLETVPRTINTGLGAMFILAALWLLGGDSLGDFALALLVGLIVGTYSSTFMATPFLTYLQEKWPMSRVKRERVKRDPEDAGAVV